MNDLLVLPISGPQGASSRYRIFQFLPALEASGVRCEVCLPSEKSRNRMARIIASMHERKEIIARTAHTRALFIQKRLFPARTISRISAKKKPFLFDFDDAIFTSPLGDRSSWSNSRVRHRLAHTLSNAACVIAGNRYLADYARQFSQTVVYLPTVLDHRCYPAKQHRQCRRVTIGWIGHAVNHFYLQALTPILQTLTRSFSLRLLVISNDLYTMPGVEVEHRRWSAETEIADILDIDIGVMPMPNDAWTQGKCGFKALQYMAAGIPVVCSKVGANPEIVRHGLDGFCIENEKEWIDALATLCADVELREKMGKSGRERVATAYSLTAQTPEFLRIVHSLLES